MALDLNVAYISHFVNLFPHVPPVVHHVIGKFRSDFLIVWAEGLFELQASLSGREFLFVEILVFFD